MIGQREFITLLGGATAWPLAVAKVPPCAMTAPFRVAPTLLACGDRAIE